VNNAALQQVYQYQPLSGYSPDSDWPYVGPRQSLIGPFRDSGNPQDRLVSSVIWSDHPDRRAVDPEAWNDRIRVGYEACKKLNDPAAWATLLRYGCQLAGNLRRKVSFLPFMLETAPV
jgi:hypothetical protein